jgi:hypothetical protein
VQGFRSDPSTFSDDGKYLIMTPFIPTVIAVAMEEFGKVCLRVQPIKSSCMVPPDTALELVEVVRAKISVVTGTSNLGAPLAMDYSMRDGPTTSHNENNAHFFPQDTVEDHQLLLDKIVCFAMSICGGAHEAFSLMITCAVRRCGFLLRTHPLIFADHALLLGDRAVHTAVFRILRVSQDVHKLDQ